MSLSSSRSLVTSGARTWARAPMIVMFLDRAAASVVASITSSRSSILDRPSKLSSTPGAASQTVPDDEHWNRSPHREGPGGQPP